MWRGVSPQHVIWLLNAQLKIVAIVQRVYSLVQIWFGLVWMYSYHNVNHKGSWLSKQAIRVSERDTERAAHMTASEFKTCGWHVS